MSWLNVGWLLLDLAVIFVLIPTVILQRRESGATLAWILVIVLIPFLGLLAFWVFGTTRLQLRRRKRRRIEARLAPALDKLQTFYGTEVAGELKRDFLSLCAEAKEVRDLEKIKLRALLVYGSVFGVAPRVTYNEYAPLGAP